MIRPTILLIDNYDSFVHNLARYVTLAGADTKIMRNDALSLDDIAALAPDGIILSPGPCAPEQAGICIELIRHFGPSIPILGVCLGHQAIGEAYGGKTIRAPIPIHGQSSTIVPCAPSLLFKDMEEPFEAARYHSLISDIEKVPNLILTAYSFDDRLPMAMQHRAYPVYGIQFHPESILTQTGHQLIENFLSIIEEMQR